MSVRRDLAGKLAVVSVVCTMMLIIIFAYVYEQKHPLVCTESYTVEKILELQYRDAKILLSNGEHRTVNQARLKPGDDFCVKAERIKQL